MFASYRGVWHFETLADALAAHSAATVAGATSTACRLGGCFSFDGDDTVVLGTDLLETAGAGAFTVSASLLPAVKPVSRRALTMTTGDGTLDARFAIGLDPGAVLGTLVRPEDGGSVVVTQGAAALSAEAAVDVTVDVAQGLLILYVDGREIARAFFPVEPPVSATPADVLQLGTDPQALLPGWIGTVDEVRFADGARTPAFILVDAASRSLALTTIDPSD